MGAIFSDCKRDVMGKDFWPGCWHSQKWRLNHLYYIIDKQARIRRFKMNWAQEELHARIHNKNTVLKARQLGMSTYTSMLILDSCLFNDHFSAGIIDKTLDDAKEKLGKITFAYECAKHPPTNVYEDHVEDEDDRRNIALFLQAYTMDKAPNCTRSETVEYHDKAERADFSNGSSIRIGVSLRGGTILLLHISEYASVAYNDPKKASEIIKGGFNTVPLSGCIIMESTHEGAKAGKNYEILKTAMSNDDEKLTEEDFRFFFFPWWKQKEYRIYSDTPLADHSEDEYFGKLEAQGIYLDEAQKRWYIAKKKVQQESMFSEYPSTPEEAFMKPVENSIYGNQISRLRANKQIDQKFEASSYHPLYVAWDFGMRDLMTLWLIQVGGDGRFYVLDYFCGKDQGLQYYIRHVQLWERQFGQLITRNLLPHDASNRELNYGLERWHAFVEAKMPYVLVPRTNDKKKGIYQVRDILKYCTFHERCSKPVVDEEGNEYMSGMDALENYRWRGEGSSGVIGDEPVHDAASHGADSFRMFAEALAANLVGKGGMGSTGASVPKYNKAKLGRAKGCPAGW